MHSRSINVREFTTIKHAVVDKIVSAFGQYQWFEDKRVVAEGAHRRPDLQLDVGSHLVVVDVTDGPHDARNSVCETRRLMELSHNAGFKPIVFLRFNPSAYYTTGGFVSSCWKLNGRGVVRIPKNKAKEWDGRIDVLLAEVMRCLLYPPTKTVVALHLFGNSGME